MSRRRALTLVGLGTAGVAAGAIGWAASHRAPAGELRGPAATGEPLRQPSQLSSHDGVLEVTLTAQAGVTLAGRDTLALGFNGASPGPTLRVRPGDLLRLRLHNQLTQPTNLHTHGLHVSPQGNGDNPFITIDPGGTFDYAIRIPADHPAGTFWYHPHHHHTVADQIFGGLVGALLVDGGTDLPTTADQILLVTDTSLTDDGRVATVGMAEKMMGREGELVLVNGQHQPVIAAPAGAALRWRVINGCTSRVLALTLTDQHVMQLSLDGHFLPTPASRDLVVLAPGNRADLLVRPTGAGAFTLVTEPYDRGDMGMMGGMGGARPGDPAPITLATLAVSGQPATEPPIPATLPAPAVPPGPASRSREVIFGMGMGGGGGPGMGGMRFTIDGRTFDPNRTDQTVTLGSTEEWTVRNTSPMDHPFHIHTWPFHVLDASAATPPTGVLQDVVLVKANGWVRLRIPFTDHPGRTVYHCHILDHEDLGMMATIDVRN